MVAGDVYRPAAIDQLHVVGEQIGVEVFSDRGNNDPVAISQAGIAHAKANGHNVVIDDTNLINGWNGVLQAMCTIIKNNETDFDNFINKAKTGINQIKIVNTMTREKTISIVLLKKVNTFILFSTASVNCTL